MHLVYWSDNVSWTLFWGVLDYIKVLFRSPYFGQIAASSTTLVLLEYVHGFSSHELFSIRPRLVEPTRETHRTVALHRFTIELGATRKFRFDRIFVSKWSRLLNSLQPGDFPETQINEILYIFGKFKLHLLQNILIQTQMWTKHSGVISYKSPSLYDLNYLPINLFSKSEGFILTVIVKKMQ